jgi:folate-binding protein YgfZ
MQEFHHSQGAQFGELSGVPVVLDYGDWLAEHAAFRQIAGVIDLSFRSRLCLVGADRARFLHGQVTNDVKKLRPGEGCYSAITTSKGKMEADLNILCFAEELLLDLEPGLTEKITHRLEKFIVADDVQIVDAAPHYGLLSVQGPKAAAVIASLALFPEIPSAPLGSVKVSDAMLGEIYLTNNPRLQIGQPKSISPRLEGFDLFVPNQSLAAVADKLIAAAKQQGGRAAGWTAFETARIEAGIPRFGADMNEANLPLECGIESRAIVYNKGCYIGQEVINRVHSFGHVNKELRGLRLADNLPTLPASGEKLFQNGKEVGYLTSIVHSPALNANIALGYVRREANQVGTELKTSAVTGETPVKIVELPFV